MITPCRRYSACICECEDASYIYVMYSNLEFCWVYTLEIDKQTQELTLQGEPKVLTIRSALLINKINDK